MKAVRFKAEGLAGSQLPLCRFGAGGSHFTEVFGLWGEKLLSSASLGLSVIEPTRKDNLGVRGAAETRG